MKALATLLSLCVISISSACYWDRDSLEFEAKRLPDVLQAIVGRFDRNPPLYYTMRLDRVTKELQRNPDQMALYDDAGVAASRLGHQDEAIHWMELKRKHFDSAHATTDDRYRTESNEGTFELLAWFAKPEPKMLDLAIQRIEAALKINPHAHFDREQYQLSYMYWLASKRAFSLTESLPYSHSEDQPDKAAVRLAQTKGLMGLMVLGPAWENPDIVGALEFTLSEHPTKTPSMGHMAELRRKELIDKGIVPLDKEFFEMGSLDSQDHAYVEDEYRRLRNEADTYENSRATFMEAQMRRGLHPDTDSRFWEGWREVSPPQVEPMSWLARNKFMVLAYTVMGILLALAIALVWLVVRGFVLHFRRSR